MLNNTLFIAFIFQLYNYQSFIEKENSDQCLVLDQNSFTNVEYNDFPFFH